jgi:hypothetical protein
MPNGYFILRFIQENRDVVQFLERMGVTIKVHQSDSDSFFERYGKELTGKVQLAVIDGNHGVKPKNSNEIQTADDLFNSLRSLKGGGFVILDDDKVTPN